MDLSIIIPVYSKYEHLRDKLNTLNSYLIARNLKYEIILIDNTKTLLLNKAINQNNYTRILKSNISSSQPSSYIEGFKVSKGDWALLLDYDLIDRSELIDVMVSNIDERYDVIRTIRNNRRHQYLLRYLGSKTASFVFNLFNKNIIRDIGSSLSLYKKEYYKSVLDKKYEKYHNFPLFILIAKPSNIKEVFVDSLGDNTDSEYSLIKLLQLFFKIIRLKFVLFFFRN